MADYHLAQLNIAQMRTPFEDPSMADFTANLERINALADQSAGFVWRLEDEEGNAGRLWLACADRMGQRLCDAGERGDWHLCCVILQRLEAR